ncbi:MAG TPA: hypothetical protein VK935_24035 [Actinomycetospora sp.]|nr:hypothetical protein [Actinomycetospora sp.]
MKHVPAAPQGRLFQILGGSGSALDVPDPTTVLDLVGYPGAPEVAGSHVSLVSNPPVTIDAILAAVEAAGA